MYRRKTVRVRLVSREIARPCFAARDEPGVVLPGVDAFRGPPPPRRTSSHGRAWQIAAREFATARWVGYAA